MSLDHETHRVVNEAGRVQALVYTISSRWVVLSTRLGDYATSDKTFRSMGELEGYVRQRRWRLEKATLFR